MLHTILMERLENERDSYEFNVEFDKQQINYKGDGFSVLDNLLNERKLQLLEFNIQRCNADSKDVNEKELLKFLEKNSVMNEFESNKKELGYQIENMLLEKSHSYICNVFKQVVEEFKRSY